MTDIIGIVEQKMPLAELVDDLRGTCKSLDIELYTVDERNELDDEIFCCEECGWWCDVDELNERDGNQLCNDCNSAAAFDD